MYRAGTDSIGLSTNGNRRMLIDTGIQFDVATTSLGRTSVIDGTLSNPSIRFSADTNTGIYRAADDDLRIVSGGTAAFLAIDGIAWVNPLVASTTNNCRIDPTFGTLIRNTSKRDTKEGIENIDSALALEAMSLLTPRRFVFKPFPNDDTEVASLRPLDEQFGFVAEEVADVSALIGVQIHEAEPPPLPTVPESATEEERAEIEEQQQQLIQNLDGYVPSYWKEPHMIALCVAAIKALKAEIEELKAG
jgi:hypothetical protein